MRRLARAAAIAAMIPCGMPGGEAAAQRPASLGLATAVTPDTVTVGDPFASVLRVLAPPGSRVEFGGVAIGDPVQPVDTVRVIAAAADSGATAVYRLVAWVAGTPISAVAPVRVIHPDGTVGSYRVRLAVPVVASVLPAGTADVRPRPSRGVVPLPAAAPWLTWAAGVLLATVAAVAVLLLVRRRGRHNAHEPAAIDQRAEALRALDEIESETRPARVYIAGARVLRRYLAAVDDHWGEEWTTTELVARVRSPRIEERGLAALADLLASADRVKFAGLQPAGRDAASFRARTREWISSYPGPTDARAAPPEAA
jgi:hypothetical protein